MSGVLLQVLNDYLWVILKDLTFAGSLPPALPLLFLLLFCLILVLEPYLMVLDSVQRMEATTQG